MIKSSSEGSLQQIGFWDRALYGLIYLIGLLPAWWHYLCSHPLALLLRRGVAYRHHEVIERLTNAFPEKEGKEISTITRKVYLNITDVMTEAFRYTHFTPSGFKRRVILHNAEVVERFMAPGSPDLFLLLGHYGNWEWLTGLQLYLPKTQFYILYKHQHGAWNYVLNRIRTRFGARLLEMDSAPREILRQSSAERDHRSYIFLADQAPPLSSSQLFTHFLNQSTAVYAGWEALARHSNAPVVYVDVRVTARGRYQITPTLITPNAAQEPLHRPTQLYMKLLEETIRRAPQHWLWTHRRWKHSIEQVKSTYPQKKITII